MIETHAIRLRGPWECETIGTAQRRVHMPATLLEILDGEHQGSLICRRPFGCPTCLDSHERVWLVIDDPALSGDADLNGEPLGRIDRAGHRIEFDITNRLRERNELILNFDFSAPQPTDAFLFADVRLEIRG